MAGTPESLEHRRGVKRNVSDAYAHHTEVIPELQEAAHEAQAKCSEKFREALGRLCRSAESVADSSSSLKVLLEQIVLLYGDKLEELQRDKERVVVAARYRDFLRLFEDGAFQRMKTLAKYKEAGVVLKGTWEALELLASMARAEMSGDEDERAVLTDENKLVREAWGQAVVAKGLQLEEYEALRFFAGDTLRFFAGDTLSQDRAAAVLLRQQQGLACSGQYAP